MKTEISAIGIVGAGQMGTGIAQLFAQNEYKVILCDQNLDIVNKSRDNIIKSLNKLIDKKKLTVDKAETILSNINIGDNLNKMSEVDLVIEAVSEKEDLKKEIFSKLNQIIEDDVIIASNTSSISITILGSVMSRPDKVVGMHFMNPAPIMCGVEIIKGLLTSDETVTMVTTLVKKIGKTPVFANDRPGFIVNRILFPMLNEAMFALYEGVSKKEEIDMGMKACCNFPIGPLALADMIGLDTVLAILNTLYDGFKDPKYKPCPLLKEYVIAGWLGRKNGKGFFEYK